MKVQTARIRLVLWTSKTLADGTSPIMLKISFNGQAMLSTHFSCKVKDWNDNDECLKRSFPNYVAINKILQDIKNQAVAAKLKFEVDQTPYTAKMVIDAMKPKELSGSNLIFEDVMKQLFVERHLKTKTSTMYESVFRTFSSFLGKSDFIITEITNNVIIEFAQEVARNHPANTVLAYISKIQSVIAFANSQDLTTHYPKKGIEWVQNNFKKTVNHKALTEIDVWKIHDYFEKIENPTIDNRSSKDFAVAYYLCIYTLFGLAPVDAARLKISNFEDVVISGFECWKINTVRSKTNQPVTIIVNKNHQGGQVLEKFVSTANNRDGYIFPIIKAEGKGYNYTSEKKEIQAISAVESTMNLHLKDVASDLKIPKFTLYSARHSFATHLIQDGVNVGTVAASLGRSVSGIGCYISNLTTDKEFLSIAR